MRSSEDLGLFVVDLQLHKELTIVKTSIEKGEQGMQDLWDSIRALEYDFDNTSVELNELQTLMENAENLPKNNNIKLCGLKEGVEEENVMQYLEDVFIGCLGADAGIKI